MGESGWTRGLSILYLAHDRDNWRVLVNVLMEFRVLQNC